VGVVLRADPDQRLRRLIALALLVAALTGAGLAMGWPAAGVAVAFAALVFVTSILLARPDYGFLEIPVLLLLLVTLSFRARTAEALAEDPLDPQALFRLACTLGAFLLGALALLRPPTPRQEVRLTSLPVRAYLLYACVAAAGILTSAFPLITGYRVLELFAMLVVLAGAYRTFGRAALSRIERMLYWYAMALLGSAWLGVLLFPSLALDPVASPVPYQIQGVVPAVSSNTIGTLGVILAIWSLVRLTAPESEIFPSRRVAAVGVVLGLASLLGAQYRTGYAALLVAVALLLLFRRKFLLSGLVVALTVAALIWVPALGRATVPLLLRGADVERATRLSGRITWWELAIPVWRESPVIGAGLQTATRFEVLAANERDVSNVHSTWVEALVGTGIAGLALLAAALLVTWRRAARLAWLRGGRMLPAMLLALITVRSLTGGGIEQGGDTSMLFLALAWGLRDGAVGRAGSMSPAAHPTSPPTTLP